MEILQSTSLSSLQLVDTHAHLTDESFRSDLSSVLQSASSAGVVAVIGVSENAADAKKLMELARLHPMIRTCFGVHPVQAGESGKRSATKADLLPIIDLIRKEANNLVGIGEVGLDFQPYLTPTDAHKDEQRYVLRQQIELANELGLTLNVHSRSAGRPTISLLKDCGARQVVLHAFDGNRASALEAIAAGFYFSIPPIVAREPQMKSVLCSLPLNRLLLESDAPALAPIKPTKDVPQRNEPKNISIAFRELCAAQKKSEEEVAVALLENTRKLFPRVFAKN